VELISCVGNEAVVHVPPVTFQVGIHAGKRTGHDCTLARNQSDRAPASIYYRQVFS
jgi:hypothetical protein